MVKYKVGRSENLYLLSLRKYLKSSWANFANNAPQALTTLLNHVKIIDSDGIKDIYDAFPNDAATTISTQNGIPTRVFAGTTVTFNGGSSVTLQRGFEAQNGSVFKAYIGGCGY